MSVGIKGTSHLRRLAFGCPIPGLGARSGLQAALALAAVGLASLRSTYGEVAAPARGIVIQAGLPLLFADDSGVASRSGVVRTVHPARTHEQPVVQPDQPWEGERVYIYGSVYHDRQTKEFRMWYLARPGQETAGRSHAGIAHAPSLRGNGFDLTLHATSHDGLHWEKPTHQLHAYDGSAANNIVFDLHSPSVLLDITEVDPARRYKMLGYLGRPYHSYHAAYSADGLSWKAYPKSSVLEHGDTITLAQDPRSGEYLAFHKRPAEVRGRGRRVVWLSRSADFQAWSEPVLVFTPDAADDDWAKAPDERTEVYDMSVYPHAAGYVGLPALFRVMKVTPNAQLGPGQSPVDGPIDIQLATSLDGRTWERSWPRLALIPRGPPGTFDAGAILGVASTAVNTATETWVYYTAINTGHGGSIPPKRITIGRADWRLHGFASLDAGPGGGRVETAPLRLAGEALVINADARRGQLRVAVLEQDGKPIAGLSAAECSGLTKDETAWRASWRGGKTIPTDRPVRIVMEMTSTRLYSLAVTSELMPRSPEAP